jgi:hypothetical protein
MRWGEIIVMLAIATFLVGGWAKLVITIAQHSKEPTCSEGWKPPDIPQCEKELWDRIREGCDDT